MADYQISKDPKFIRTVKMLEAIQYAHADLFNAIYQVLFENDTYLNEHKADANHTHDDMVAATTENNGKEGLVPAPAKGNADRYLRSDGTWQKPPNDNTTYNNMKGATASAAGGAGLVPAPAKGNADRYLRSDGTWQKPPNDNTTYSNMKAATASAAGGAGLVPAPAAGAQGKFLRGDGTWQTPPDTNTTYSAASQSANGLMSAADKKKLDGIATSANNYSHPTNAGNKHIPAGGASGQILRWSADGTAAWGNDNNTTYSAATQSAAGLMSAADKKKLDGVAASANNYSHPANHAASMITQDATHRFVSDTEKSTWNGKAAGNHSHSYLPLSGGTMTGNIVMPNYGEIAANNTSSAISYATKHGFYFQGNFVGILGDFRLREIRSMNSASSINMMKPEKEWSGVSSTPASSYTNVIASAFTVASSRRFKENIVSITDEEAKNLLKFNPVKFDYKGDGDKKQYGFIAEEVEEIQSQGVLFDEESEERLVVGLDYSKFVPQLLKLVQMQEKRISELEKQM